MTKIVSLANQKGGVGKTTTAINLGASLAACERSVLLVDLDPQANATSGVGRSKSEEKSTYPVLVDEMPIRDIIVPTELPTLFLAPSSVDLVGAEVELRDAIGREHYLRRALEPTDGVRDAVNPNLEIEGIILTMFDERVNRSRQVAEEVRTHFGEKVYQTVIPRNVRLGEAPSFGKPIILYDIRSRGSEAYISLAKEFIQRAETGRQ